MNKATVWTAGLVFGAGSVLWPGVSAVQAQPSEEEIEAAILQGIEWLVPLQAADGSWGDHSCDRVATTALVLLKLETRAIELGLEPLSGEYEYSGQVQAGLAYLLAHQVPQAIGVQEAGDPDANGNGLGLYFTDCGGHIMYNTGCVAMALAASGDPLTYGLALQDTCDFLCWAQADPSCGIDRGGWRYNPNECSSDNSNSGYVTLGLGFAAAAPPYGFSMVIPDWVKDELSIWVDVIQDDVDGDPDDGGSWYDPHSAGVNILKTGNLLYEMALVGDSLDVIRVQDAIDYMERQWNGLDPWTGGHMWRDHRQAMFTMMKGFEVFGIELIDLDGDGTPELDWFAEVSQHLIETQEAAGSWPNDPWGGPILSTAWAMLTLERVVQQVGLTVAVDIKPTSCPNPFNRGNPRAPISSAVTGSTMTSPALATGVARPSDAVLPVAILGTEDFDVTTINPMTLVMFVEEGMNVMPLRWAYEDVATPYLPFEGREDCYDCNEDGPDGFVDLTLKYQKRDLAALLGDFSRGDCVVVYFSGFLKEEFGGTAFTGEDVITIVK